MLGVLAALTAEMLVAGEGPAEDGHDCWVSSAAGLQVWVSLVCGLARIA